MTRDQLRKLAALEPKTTPVRDNSEKQVTYSVEKIFTDTSFLTKGRNNDDSYEGKE